MYDWVVPLAVLINLIYLYILKKKKSMSSVLYIYIKEKKIKIKKACRFCYLFDGKY